MKKALVVATVIRFLGFERNDITILQELGYEVHCAANLSDEMERTKSIDMIRHQIDFSRSPFSKQTIIAYRQLKELMEKEHFDLVHCHTPVAAICARLVCRPLRKSGVKVIYTAHGFHFYKGAPMKNWLLYYPLEKLCSRWTDVLITINKEDYALAAKRMRAKRVEYIPGVGLDVDKYAETKVDRASKRREIGVPEDAFMILSVGELNKNKNHKSVIRALSELHNPSVHYVIAGRGELDGYLCKLAQSFGIGTQVHLIGYREDLPKLYMAADMYIHPSLREGLPVALMEAMGSGLPCIASDIRGNRDLLGVNKNLLFSPEDKGSLEEMIKRMLEDSELRDDCSKRNRHDIIPFSLERVRKEMERIYAEIGV